MVALDFRGEHPPRPLRYTLADSPHATIESNRDCNMACRACYNLERAGTKSLEEIAAEVEMIAAKRNLSVITILGGEPTLHPHLAGIISLVKRRGLHCQLLTNGLAFLEPRGNALLDDLAGAGIDKVIIHVDSGQGLSASRVQARRLALFSLLESKRLRFSLALTIYNDESAEIAKAIRRYSRFRYFDGVLAVLARASGQEETHTVQMIDVYRQIKTRLGALPVAFIPSSRSNDEVCWLIYMVFVNCGSGRVATLPPSLNLLFRALYRLVRGRHFFIIRGDPGWAAIQFLAATVLSAVARPASLPGLLGLARRSSWLANIRLHYIAVQEPPLFDASGSLVRICRHCPDATIRNGKLTPVCLADHINPLSPAQERIHLDWRHIVYGHLGEPD